MRFSKKDDGGGRASCPCVWMGGCGAHTRAHERVWLRSCVSVCCVRGCLCVGVPGRTHTWMSVPVPASVSVCLYLRMCVSLCLCVCAHACRGAFACVTVNHDRARSLSRPSAYLRRRTRRDTSIAAPSCCVCQSDHGHRHSPPGGLGKKIGNLPPKPTKTLKTHLGKKTGFSRT